MTREQAQAEREAFNAFCDGKEIQQRHTGHETWIDCASPLFVSDYEHRIKPVPKMVPLGPGDLAGAIIRTKSDPICWRTVLWVNPYQFSMGTATREPWVWKYEELQANGEISRDGGKTWQRAEKPEVQS